MPTKIPNTLAMIVNNPLNGLTAISSRPEKTPASPATSDMVAASQ